MQSSVSCMLIGIVWHRAIRHHSGNKCGTLSEIVTIGHIQEFEEKVSAYLEQVQMFLGKESLLYCFCRLATHCKFEGYL